MYEARVPVRCRRAWCFTWASVSVRKTIETGTASRPSLACRKRSTLCRTIAIWLKLVFIASSRSTTSIGAEAGSAFAVSGRKETIGWELPLSESARSASRMFVTARPAASSTTTCNRSRRLSGRLASIVSAGRECSAGGAGLDCAQAAPSERRNVRRIETAVRCRVMWTVKAKVAGPLPVMRGLSPVLLTGSPFESAAATDEIESFDR